MKKLLNFLPLLILLPFAACTKSSDRSTNPVNLPKGNFAGQFMLVHQSSLTGKLDTSYANITLSLSSSGNFAVAGDTSKIQAGSFGTYSEDASMINFTDITINKRTPNTSKKHLNGSFNYTYGNSTLKMTLVADTLFYNYNLTSY